jgi:hypothetical protein
LAERKKRAMPRTKSQPTVPAVFQRFTANLPAMPWRSQPPARRTPLAAMLDQSPVPIDAVVKALSARVNDLSGQVQGLTSRLAVRRSEAAARRAWWIAGISVGFVSAGAAAFLIARRRQHLRAEQDLVALPTPPAANGHHSPAEQVRNTLSRLTRRAGSQTGTEPAMQATATTATAKAAFVGNVHTMVYHPSDSEHLPAEENRIYFASEDEAIEAGYRPAGE